MVCKHYLICACAVFLPSVQTIYQLLGTDHIELVQILQGRREQSQNLEPAHLNVLSDKIECCLVTDIESEQISQFPGHIASILSKQGIHSLEHHSLDILLRLYHSRPVTYPQNLGNIGY